MSSVTEKIKDFINSQDGPIRRFCHRVCAYFERDQAARENLAAFGLILIGIIVPQTWLEWWLNGFIGVMLLCVAVTILGFIPGFIWYTILKLSGSSEKARGIWMFCLGLVWYGMWLGAWALRDTSEMEPIRWGFWDDKPAPDVSFLMQWIGDDDTESSDDSANDSTIEPSESDAKSNLPEKPPAKLPAPSTIDNRPVSNIKENESAGQPSKSATESTRENEASSQDEDAFEAALD